jgi:hypothetical protein
MATVPAALDVAGDSSNWLAQRQNHLRIFEVFRTSDDAITALYPVVWVQLDEATFCPTELAGCVYAQGADILLRGYVIEAGQKNAGQRLSFGVAIKVLAGWVNHAKDRFLAKTTREATKHFFTCLDLKSTTPRSTTSSARSFWSTTSRASPRSDRVRLSSRTVRPSSPPPCRAFCLPS